MRRVIVLGGYGGFGARLSRRLSADGWQVFVAGRNARSAEALAMMLPNARALVADRTGDLSPLLRELHPFLLIDAAGPFQGSDYRVARACIAERVHYIDLADAREFVCGIEELNSLAISAGVAVISGASSVPALSGAVVADLVRGMDAVRSVSMSISASSRATAGASVTAAILSYAGKPVRLWRGRRWQYATGWQMVRYESYANDARPMKRLVALVDVPDHAILPEKLPGRPAVIFRAGPEFSLQLRFLWILSWFVRWGWVSTLSGLYRLLRSVQRLTAFLGSDRSAMKVSVTGMTDGVLSVRSWTLLADRGDGPEIPTLAAQLLARALCMDRLPVGACNASGFLNLSDFREKFVELAVRETCSHLPSIPLYRRIMGERFSRLPVPVQQMHEIGGDGGAAGFATVTRGQSPLAGMIASIMGFPPAGEHPVHVTFEENDGKEKWIRDFSGCCFSSELSETDGFLVERFGPMRFYFALPSSEHGLEMDMRKWSVFGMPLPMFFAPRSVAKEWSEGDDFVFDVKISLPLISDLVHYRGRLRRL
ncbi:MAG: DUF4166 domain-containing protein [Burkholderiales bacterium]|nr:DUF4166 domain-containing protein [Burkholderiales bacterium]